MQAQQLVPGAKQTKPLLTALADSIGGLIFGSLPGILMIYLLRGEGAGMVGGAAFILLLRCTLYFFSITLFGGRLEQNRERIADALS